MAPASHGTAAATRSCQEASSSPRKACAARIRDATCSAIAGARSGAEPHLIDDQIDDDDRLAKKLVLRLEYIVQLTPEQLRHVPGGSSAQDVSCSVSCSKAE
jgi:hypothetical protein